MPLWNWRRETLGSCTLPGDIFNVPIRRDILQRVVRWQLAKRQQVHDCTSLRGKLCTFCVTTSLSMSGRSSRHELVAHIES